MLGAEVVLAILGLLVVGLVVAEQDLPQQGVLGWPIQAVAVAAVGQPLQVRVAQVVLGLL
jgi:hypothetical protein